MTQRTRVPTKDNDPLAALFKEVDLALKEMLKHLGISVTNDDIRQQVKAIKPHPGRDQDKQSLATVAGFLLDSARKKELVSGSLFSDLAIHGDIKSGQKGLPVAVSQVMLRELSFYHGVLDASYGPASRGAVEQFQKHVMKLEKPTGIIDSATQAALSAAYMSQMKEKDTFEVRKAELKASGFSLKDIELGGAKELTTALTALGVNREQFVANYNSHNESISETSRFYPSLASDQTQILAAARLQLAERVIKSREALKAPDIPDEQRAEHIKTLQTSLEGLGVTLGKDKSPAAIRSAAEKVSGTFSYLHPDGVKGIVNGMPAGYGIDKTRITVDLATIENARLKGYSSFYNQGKTTASNVAFDPSLPIIAVPQGHEELLGTIARVKVTNAKTGSPEYVTGVILDTGPFYKPEYNVNGVPRINDLTPAVTKSRDLIINGLNPAEMQIDIAATIEWRKKYNIPYKYGQEQSAPSSPKRHSALDGSTKLVVTDSGDIPGDELKAPARLVVTNLKAGRSVAS